MNIATKKFITVATGLVLAASVAVPAFAQVGNPGSSQGSGARGQGNGTQAPGHQAGRQGGDNGNGMMNRGVVGTVSAISGSTITLSGRQGFASTTTMTTYTVNASSAVVRKGNATSTVSAIAVGDKVMVQGTVTGTSVTAKVIIDGVYNQMMGGRGQNGNRNNPGSASSTPFMGNGQPIVAGSITAISGSTITVTTMSSTTYTVDATNAKILQGPNPVSLSTLTVGERVIVQGTVNGNSVVATAIIDQVGHIAAPGSTQQGQNNNKGQNQSKGFFGNIGGFFKHLFGF